MHCFVVDPIARKGGLVLFWENDINVKVVSCSSLHIEVIILDSFDHRPGVLLVSMAHRSLLSELNLGSLLMHYVIGTAYRS